MPTVQLAPHGQHLSSRFTASAIRDVLEPHLRKGEPIHFDFDGVESVTESFMHELLRPPVGIPLPNFLGLLTFSHCNPVAVQTIRFVVGEVLQAKQEPVIA